MADTVKLQTDPDVIQLVQDRLDAARYRWLRKADQDKVQVYFANSELPGGWNDWNAWANKDDGIDHYMQESDHD